MESWASLIIGAVAGGLYLGCSKLLLKKRIDDAVDAIPVHVSYLWERNEIICDDAAASDNFAPFVASKIIQTDDQWTVGMHQRWIICEARVDGYSVQQRISCGMVLRMGTRKW